MEKNVYNPYHAKGSVIFSRIRAFFMGQEPPSAFTRINCNLALLYLIYIFGWSLVVFIALNFGRSLPSAGNWEKLFLAVGLKYNIPNIYFSFTVYLVTLFVASAGIFAGMITAWRKRLAGFVLVVVSAAVSTVAPLFILGTAYVRNECAWWEFVSGGLIISLFTTDYIIRKKRLRA